MHCNKMPRGCNADLNATSGRETRENFRSVPLTVHRKNFLLFFASSLVSASDSPLQCPHDGKSSTRRERKANLHQQAGWVRLYLQAATALRDRHRFVGRALPSD